MSHKSFICPICSAIESVYSEVLDRGNNQIVECYYAYCRQCNYRSSTFSTIKELEKDIKEDLIDRIYKK